MRLTVLGGSAAGPNVGAGCSGYLLDSGTTRVVLDLGPGTLPELRRHCDFRRLDALVVSHLHLDHTLDLLALRFALAYNPVPPPAPLPLWLPPGGRDFLDRAAAAFTEPENVAAFFRGVFAVAEYDPSRRLTLAPDLAIDFLPTRHYVPCWAMRARAGDPGRDLVYTADTGPLTGLAPFAAGAQLLVAEATAAGPQPEPADERGHLTPEEAAAIARDAAVRTMVVSHVWEEYGAASITTRAGTIFGGRIELARPGLCLEW